MARSRQKRHTASHVNSKAKPSSTAMDGAVQHHHDQRGEHGDAVRRFRRLADRRDQQAEAGRRSAEMQRHAEKACNAADMHMEGGHCHDEDRA